MTVKKVLIGRGFKVWAKGGYERIYIDNLCNEIQEMADKMAPLTNVKGFVRKVSVYYDCQTEKFVWSGLTGSRQATADNYEAFIRSFTEVAEETEVTEEMTEEMTEETVEVATSEETTEVESETVEAEETVTEKWLRGHNAGNKWNIGVEEIGYGISKQKYNVVSATLTMSYKIFKDIERKCKKIEIKKLSYDSGDKTVEVSVKFATIKAYDDEEEWYSDYSVEELDDEIFENIEDLEVFSELLNVSE